MSVREHVAMAIYAAAFAPSNEAEAKRQKPSPGWCWERCGPQMQLFALKQADAALEALKTYNK